MVNIDIVSIFDINIDRIIVESQSTSSTPQPTLLTSHDIVTANIDFDFFYNDLNINVAAAAANDAAFDISIVDIVNSDTNINTNIINGIINIVASTINVECRFSVIQN